MDISLRFPEVQYWQNWKNVCTFVQTNVVEEAGAETTGTLCHTKIEMKQKNLLTAAWYSFNSCWELYLILCQPLLEWDILLISFWWFSRQAQRNNGWEAGCHTEYRIKDMASSEKKNEVFQDPSLHVLTEMEGKKTYS